VEKSLESGRKNELNNARKNSQSGSNNGSENSDDKVETAKNLGQVFTPWGLFSLLKHVDLLKDLPFMAALFAGILKDVLDLVVVGDIPGVGIIFTIFIGMMFYLTGTSSKSSDAKNTIKRVISLLTAMIGEDIPLLAVLPLETAVVIINYMWTLSDRKIEHEREQRESKEHSGYEN
jgi:hypothetical protein